MKKGENVLSPNRDADHSFPPSARLLKSKEYIRVYKAGKVRRGRHLQIHTCRNESVAPRLGISVGKRAGKAVKRNLLKRWIREIVRTHKADLPDGMDVVVQVRESSGELNFERVRQELLQLLKSSRRNWNP
ncbi:MAG: ribonuclease P protein component [Terriglobia bacterium]